MIIGVCSIKLKIYAATSLKDKRQAVRSIIGRIQSRFNVSIAEIGENDNWQISLIGFSCVTNDTNHANQVISKVLKFIDGDSRVEIIDHNIEIL